jgi:hypothetical protein
MFVVHVLLPGFEKPGDQHLQMLAGSCLAQLRIANAHCLGAVNGADQHGRRQVGIQVAIDLAGESRT